MAHKKSLIEKYHRQQKQSKILELIAEGKTYNEIATEVGVSRQYVTDTLKTELASATTPEKILELRNHQNETLSSHTPRLHKRFLAQTNLTDRLATKYEQLIEEEGLYTYSHLYQLAKEEILQETPDIDPKDLHKQASTTAQLEQEQYRYQRDQIAKEMERTAKLGDQHYQTLLKHNERLAKLNGLDQPQAHSLMIHRSDDIKISLIQDIKATQSEIEAQQSVVEATVVEESEEND